MQALADSDQSTTGADEDDADVASSDPYLTHEDEAWYDDEGEVWGPEYDEDAVDWCKEPGVLVGDDGE